MNRIIIVSAAALAVVAGGGFYLSQTGPEVHFNASVEETQEAAKAFCESKGGTAETIAAAEGTVLMCNLPDGTSVEATQYMIDNKSG